MKEKQFYLSQSMTKIIGKQIVELHEEAYRRGFQHGANFILGIPHKDTLKAYDKLTKWRFVENKKGNSPFNYKYNNGKIGYLAKIHCDERPLKLILEDCGY